MSSEIDVPSLKVAELKAELSKRGLKVSGLKAELAARLQESIDAEKGEEAPAEAEEEPAPVPAEVEEAAPARKEVTTKRKREDEDDEMAQEDEAPVAPEPEPAAAARGPTPPPNDPVGHTAAPPTLTEAEAPAERTTKRARIEDEAPNPPTGDAVERSAPPPSALPPPPPPSALPPPAPSALPPAPPPATETIGRVAVERSPSPEPAPLTVLDEATAWLLPADASEHDLHMKDVAIALHGKASTPEAFKNALSALAETHWSPSSTVTLPGILSHDPWAAGWVYLAYASLDAPRSELNRIASSLANEDVYGDIVITRFVPACATTVPPKLIPRADLTTSIQAWLQAEPSERDALFSGRMENLRMMTMTAGDARSAKADRIEAALREVFAPPS